MTAGSIALLAAFLELFGAVAQISGGGGALAFPEGARELSLGIYLIARGLRPHAALFARDRRDIAAGGATSACARPSLPTASPRSW